MKICDFFFWPVTPPWSRAEQLHPYPGWQPACQVNGWTQLSANTPILYTVHTGSHAGTSFDNPRALGFNKLCICRTKFKLCNNNNKEDLKCPNEEHQDIKMNLIQHMMGVLLVAKFTLFLSDPHSNIL